MRATFLSPGGVASGRGAAGVLAFALLGLVSAATDAVAQTVERTARDAEAARVDSVFGDFDGASSPGCAVGVRRGGELALARGYGMADLEHHVPITPSTVFRIGSVSKQFTAAAVLLLADDGALSLDDPVRAWVPELPERDPPATIRHLLHHTSGIRDYLGLMRLAGKRERDYYTDGEVLRMLARQEAPNFPAGSDHMYSNSGYFLLGRVVRAATDGSLREFARERIFGPLGMDSSHYHDDPDHLVPGRATGHATREDGGWRISVTTLPIVGDGGVFTSLEDFLRWDANFEDPSVGGPPLPERMAERGVLADGDTLEYAMGLAVDRHRGLLRIGHGGSFVGYRAGAVRYPEQEFSAAAFCNRADADPMGRLERVARIYLGPSMEPPEEERREKAAGDVEDEAGDRPGDEGARGEAEPSRPREELELYAGRYYSPELDAVYRVGLDPEGRLRLTVGNRLDGALEPAGEDVFRRRSLELRFREPAEGRDSAAVSPGFRLDADRVGGIRFERVEEGESRP